MKTKAQEQPSGSILRKAKAFEILREVAVFATCVAGAFQLSHAIPNFVQSVTLPSWCEHLLTALLGAAIGVFALRDKSGGDRHD